MDLEKIKKKAGIVQTIESDSKKAFFNYLFKPTFNISTLKSGYLEEGTKNMVANQAICNIDIRFAHNVTVDKIFQEINAKVIEFSKSANKIILSHTRIYETVRKTKPDTERKRAPSAAGRGHKKVKPGIERTTFGDITELAALKTEMEKNENKKKKEGKNADNKEKSK